MELDSKYLKLDVSLYGKNEPITDTLSKCRVRIFYKGLNRNRTYISDEFANQLIASLPYAPIKGIFDTEGLDYNDHGERNSDGRVYGVVAAEPNFAWETHTDLDGVSREYACADVILFTALYAEANLISGKSQSMEIYRKGLTGEWKIWEEDKQPYFHFYTGSLLGLQILGDDIEPCFEGSSFFSLCQDVKELYSLNTKIEEKEESEVEKNIFKLSDNEKAELLFDALNSGENFTIICDVYDEYAIVYDTKEKKYYRAYYTKNENTITIDDKKECYILDVTTEEKAVLDSLSEIGSYSEIKEKLDTQAEQITTYSADLAAAQTELDEFKKEKEEDKKEEEENYEKKDDSDSDSEDEDKDKNSLDASEEIESYQKKISEMEAEILRLNQLNADITNEKSELEEFKKNADKESKNSIIEEFSSYLSDEQVQNFKDSMDNYSVEDFKKEVCFSAYNANSSSLLTPKEEPDLIYKNTDKSTASGVFQILNKYKGGNK